MAKLWPRLNSISDLTLRTEMAGILKPETCMAWVKSSALTSGATWRRMVPPGMIVGMKLRRTPYSLNWMVTVGAPACPEPPDRDILRRLGSYPVCRFR